LDFLRHSCANLLISQRVPLIEVQQWLDHSTIATTADLYAHLDFAAKLNSAETIKKIEDLSVNVSYPFMSHFLVAKWWSVLLIKNPVSWRLSTMTRDFL